MHIKDTTFHMNVVNNFKKSCIDSYKYLNFFFGQFLTNMTDIMHSNEKN